MRRPRSRTFCLFAGIVATTCIGCAAVTSTQQVDSRAGQESFQGYNETAVVSADGKTITVGPYPASTSCAAIMPVARESKTQVALFLKRVSPWHGHGCEGGATAPGHMAVAPVFAANIRLRDPLGNRKLVNGTTGQGIAWVSARVVLRLTGTSYRLRSIVPTGRMSGAQGIAAGATQYYVRSDGSNGLAIVQSAGNAKVPGPAPGGWVPIVVRGHSGRATRNLVTWRENGLTDYLAVEYAVETANMDYPQVLTTKQLIAIADTATSYSPGPLPIPGR
ncbi:MAG TPA: hypothetical protein VF070_28140 [Streptosporangiaceae bacterium]